MVSLRSAGLLILLVLVSYVAHCAPMSAKQSDDISSRFQLKQQRTKTFQCKIRQVFKTEDLDQPITSKGHIYYKAPDKLLIQFEDPSTEFTLVNGENIYIKKADEDVVHRKRKVNGPPTEGMSSLLSVFRSGGEAFESQYNVSTERVKDEFVVTLTPREDVGSHLPHLIRTVLRARDLEIKSIQVELSATNAITYYFESPKRDGTIDDEIFNVGEK